MPAPKSEASPPGADTRHFLARKLKAMRTQNGWSLARTAQETGVSKAMLGQIERGESAPTLAILWKIAGGFKTSLSGFLEAPPRECDGTLHRLASTLRRQPASDDMLVAPLFPFDARFGFEMLELTLLPGYERLSEPHAAGVTEHVIVLSGVMELLVDGQWHRLDQGAAVRFAGDRAHGYRNPGQETSRIHNLIHYGSGA